MFDDCVKRPLMASNFRVEMGFQIDPPKLDVTGFKKMSDIVGRGIKIIKNRRTSFMDGP